MLVIFGCGGHAREVAAVALAEELTRSMAFWSENPADTAPWSYPLQQPRRGDHLHIAVGNNHARKRVAEQYADVCDFRALASDRVDVAAHPGESVRVGTGSYIAHRVYLGPDCEVGRHVILNRGAQVSHDCKIADYAHLAPGVNLGGGVKIGEGAFLGLGVIVAPGVEIHEWSFIDAGAVVTHNVPPRMRVYGPNTALRKVDKYPEYWQPQRRLKLGEFPL